MKHELRRDYSEILVPVEVNGTPEELETLRKIRNECREFMTHDTHEITPEEQAAWWPRKKRMRVFLYFVLCEPAGYGILRVEGEEGKERSWLTGGLLPEYRARGFGRQLFSHLMRNSRFSMWLEVRLDNTSAVRLYHFLGFRPETSPDGNGIIQMSWDAGKVFVVTPHWVTLVDTKTRELRRVQDGGTFWSLCYDDEWLYTAFHMGGEDHRVNPIKPNLEGVGKHIQIPIDLYNLHQAAIHQQKMYITSPGNDAVGIWHMAQDQWESWFLDPKIRHGATGNCHHFNSIFVDDHRILVVAHNRPHNNRPPDVPSEIWIFDHDRQLLGRHRAGFGTHDVWMKQGEMYYLDSFGGRLSTIGGYEAFLGGEVNLSGFARGVAWTDEYLYVGVSKISLKATRDEAHVNVIDPKTMLVLARIFVPNEICEIRVPGRKDYCYPGYLGPQGEWM